jgi:hypothetical protein
MNCEAQVQVDMSISGRCILISDFNTACHGNGALQYVHWPRAELGVI